MFDELNIQAPMRKRDMLNTPKYLYNIFLIYDIEQTGTQLGLFYTVKGDTLIAGAGQSQGNFIPNVYSKEFGTLNFSLFQKLNDTRKLGFQAKNLLDPEIETVYRHHITDEERTRTSFRKGMEFSISLSAEF